MAKTVTAARRPDATAGTDTIYRSLFDSFNQDKDGGSPRWRCSADWNAPGCNPAIRASPRR